MAAMIQSSAQSLLTIEIEKNLKIWQKMNNYLKTRRPVPSRYLAPLCTLVLMGRCFLSLPKCLLLSLDILGEL